MHICPHLLRGFDEAPKWLPAKHQAPMMCWGLLAKFPSLVRSQPRTHGVRPGMRSTHGSSWLHVAAESATQSQPMINDHSPSQVATLAGLGCTWFYFLANFKASHRCVDADYRSFKKIQWGFAFVFSHFKHAYRISDADYRNFNKTHWQ